MIFVLTFGDWALKWKPSNPCIDHLTRLSITTKLASITGANNRTELKKNRFVSFVFWVSTITNGNVRLKGYVLFLKI
jgi:hypothetical protein